MSTRKRLAVLLGMLALASAPLTGCGGAECGPGTQESDGECVVDGALVTDSVCADGTVLVEGSCVVDDSGCGEGTQLNPDSGVCETVPGFCGEGTSWDSGDEQCVPNTDITCGEGTQADNGQCVPALDQICGDKTSADSEGRCVIGADACGTGSELDPNSGECVVTETACGAGLAFDSDSGTCTATADVCDTGTKFDADSGLCLPDACQSGDVLLNGVCVSPAEELAANADVDEVENNDPAMGGNAQELTVKAVGETTVFTGVIDAPSDLDGDSLLDQDRDVFTFDATAGQWFQLAVQSTGLPAPGFMVEGPNGYMRYSSVGLTADAARQLAVPYDGTYTVTVLPSQVMQTGSEVGPSGNADWSWVGALEQLDAPTAVDVDLSSANMTGSYDMLTDNLFNLTGLTPGDLVVFRMTKSGADAEALFQTWGSATELRSTTSVSEGDFVRAVVPASGNLLVLLDWVQAEGPQLEFDVSGAVDPNAENLGAIADDASATSTAVDIDGGNTFKYVFSVNSGQVIEFAFENTEGDDVDIVLNDAGGNELYSEGDIDVLSSTSGPDIRYWYTETGGTFLLEVTPTSSTNDLTGVTAQISTATPNDLGAVAVGDSINATISDAIAEDYSAFHMFTVSNPIEFSGTLTSAGGETLDAALWDTTNTELASYSSGGTVTLDSTFVQTAGIYLLRVEGVDAVPSYDVSLDFVAPPLSETEPNDTDATANAYEVGRDLQGMTSDVNELDVYTFTVPSDMAADEVFIAELVSLTSGSDTYRCELRDSSGTVVGASDADGDEDGCIAMTTGLLASETYYLEIERMEYSDDDDYVISSRIETGVLEVEPNDADTSATSFVLDDMVTGGSLFGTLPLDTDTDYFSFTLASDRPTDESLTFSGQAISAYSTSTMDWRLLDGTLTELAAGDLDEDLTVTGLTAGTYYLELTRTSSSGYYGGDYQVSVTSEIPVCGNGIFEPGEACEDGNTTGGDGCSATCTVESGAVIPIAASGQLVGLTGSLDSNDSSYSRPYASCGSTTNDTYYDSYRVVNNTGSAQTITVTASWPDFDGYLHVYSSGFDAADPTASCVDGDDDYNGTSGSQVTSVSIAAGEELVVVPTTYSDLTTGSYSLEIATD